MRIRLLFSLVFISVTLFSLGKAAESVGNRLHAPLLDDLGDHTHKITTDDDRAQQYFDQGLILHYGFNHAEAVRSFRQAQEYDPDCAMAYWGEALSLGPHINSGMSRAAVSLALDALATARVLADNASEKERAYIDALSVRYSSDKDASRDALDRKYADTMRVLARRFPEDADAQALLAEALMITTAWDYWRADGSPNSTGSEILEVLNRSLDKTPYHPGTNHFLIHTVETRHPERGMDAADRMRDLVPQVGHLQHMPSHIYLQVGRYADATLANQKAVQADREYMDSHGAHGMYRISYIPHNAIYLCFTTAMEGNSEACLRAAETVRELILEDQLFQPGYGSLTQGYSLRYSAMARFGKWDELLKEPAPPDELLFPASVWHYARGMAFLRTNQMDSARASLASLRRMTDEDIVDQMDFRSTDITSDILMIAVNTLHGEINAELGHYQQAIETLENAVELEDNLGYFEPPVWFSPARHTLGAVLLENDQPARAEEVYLRSLDTFPANGWSLFGLHQSLKAQGKSGEAAEALHRFKEAWSASDIELTSSRL